VSWTINQALQEAVSFLRARGIEGPRKEAEYLLCFLLEKERAYLYAHGEHLLSDPEKNRFLQLLGQRGCREPLAYLTGEKEFMGKTFLVNRAVLIPRPETEHLVEAANRWLRETYPRQRGGEGFSLLDLGTGCGNIAVMLALVFPAAAITAVDHSAEALQVARENAVLHGVDDRVKTICSSFWRSLAPGQHRFQAVISNPPYVPRSTLASLTAEVQKEPRSALDGGDDGLEAYRKILPNARDYLTIPGLVALEVGENQAESVGAIARSAGLMVDQIILDYGSRERVILLRA